MRAFLEKHQQDTLVSEIQRKTLNRNLKRKDSATLAIIEADYTNFVHPIKKPCWKREKDVLYLEDSFTRQICVIFPHHMAPCIVLGNQKAQIYDISRHVWVSPNLPELPRDILSVIFKHLGGQDLLSCRLVSNLWSKTASCPLLWRPHLDKFHPTLLAPWRDLPLYIQYVQQTRFQLDTLAKLCLRSAAHFSTIFRCPRIIENGTHPMIPESFRVAVVSTRQRYWIPYGVDEIRSDEHGSNLHELLEAYKEKYE